jgi:hypothetical protein
MVEKEGDTPYARIDVEEAIPYGDVLGPGG